MKTIVVYKSMSGFTKKYAEWIAEELGADLVVASKINADRLCAYDTIIYGSGLYAGGIGGVKLITKNLSKLSERKIVVFATGASPEREETIRDILKRNFTEEQLQTIKFFYMRGGFDFQKLPFIYRCVMTLFKRSLKNKKVKTPDEEGMLNAYETPVDFTDKENISELRSYVNS